MSPAPIAHEAVQPKVIVLQPQPIAKSNLEVWTPYLPLVLTMVGWFVVSRQQDKRERRKEVRDLIRQTEQRVNELLEKASEYYALNGNDPKCKSLEHGIRSGFMAASKLLGRITAAGLSHRADNEFITFKQAVTGGQFESVSRKQVDSAGAILAEAAAAGFSFTSRLDETYFSAFPVRMTPVWKFWAK